MSRTSELCAALRDEPCSTSQLYSRIGYLTLTRLGLVPYAAFRAELAKLEADGHAVSFTAPDGSTMWSQPPAEAGGCSDIPDTR